MLFGTLIFIKKSGGDGSKFPVTNRCLKIGRSDECVIRIQNPLISPEHCQLTVDDNGQAKIRNLSSTNPTVLNDQPLGNGEFVLHQGDVFKVGERYARWEYKPSSKYYNQPSISSQRLVAVVPPQERISTGLEGSPTVDFNQALKRRYSERVSSSGNESVKQTVRRSLGAGKVVPNKAKLISRRSLQLKRLAFSPQVKLRKVTNLESSGTPNATSENKTPLRRSSTWEVKIVTPEKGKSPQMIGTNRKSTPIKMPVTQLSNETLIKSTMRSASKIPNLLTIAETSPTANMSATRSSDEVPENLNSSPKSPMKIAKTPTPKKIKLMSPRKSLSRTNKKKNFCQSMLMDEVQVSPRVGGTPGTRRTSRKFMPSEKATLRKSVLKKSVSEADLKGRDEKRTPEELPGTPKGKLSIQPIVAISRMVEKVERSKDIMSETPQRTPAKSEKNSRIELSTRASPLTPKYSEKLSSKKSIPSGVLCTPKEKENIRVSPGAKSASARKTGSAATTKTPPKRGTKREFSAVASAERAAKKLKTIAPTKPDKNKKAALLVLGKATRKLKAVQNTNVVIKQKIVKKAIKLSTKSKKRVKQAKKASPKTSMSPKKGAVKDSRKFPVSSTETLTRAGRHSTSIGKAATKDTSLLKTPASTPERLSGKSLSSPVLGQASSSEILNPSVHLKATDVKSDTISSNSGSISFQYNSQVVYDPSRRVSKRLSSQNVSSRPDFTELTPTALGLTPRSILPEFKSPKPTPRRSSSLVTPKYKVAPCVLKSASTSKIHRKSVRFSAKDFNDSSFTDMNVTSETIFDFDGIQTPNITIDRFISPMSDEKTPKVQLKPPSSVVKSIQRDVLHSDLKIHAKSDDATIPMETRSQTSPEQPKRIQKRQRSPRNDLTDVRGVKQLYESPRQRKSPKNDLTDVRGVKELLGSPRSRKSPKNDLTDVRGVKELLGSPRSRKSPKNDLTDVRGVKQLYKSPRQKKSPKNDLTDIRGVKQLLGSPRSRKSPKNDLTDVRGVKQLLGSPRSRKSPKNDLTDVRGVKQLYESPRQKKSPKNDLTDVRGVKELLGSPRSRKSPKNDLTDIGGVKQLYESSRQRKSPRNDLTDVTGVKQLLITKSPSNDLTNVSGLETLFKSPPNKIQCLRTLYNPVSKSSKNDLSNVSGVRQLFSMNKENNNLDVSLTGVAELFLSPKKSDSPKKRTREAASIATAAKVSLTSSVQSVDNKPALRGITRSATKVSRTSRAAAVQSPVKSDEESPKVVKRATRNARAAKPEQPAETKRTRTKSEVEVKDDGIAEEKMESRSTRATRKQPTKRPVETLKSLSPIKRTRKATLVEEKPATPAKTSKAKEPAKDATPESKPSPIRTRRKSVAKRSPKTVKRSTRAKASETFEEESRPKTKAKTAKETAISTVKTRQRKVKEASPAKKETKSSPIRTRRRAK